MWIHLSFVCRRAKYSASYISQLIARAYIAGLLLYEYVITFDQEIAVVWKRKFNLASLLLLAARWTMMWGPLAGHTPSTRSTCEFTKSLLLALNLHLMQIAVVSAA